MTLDAVVKNGKWYDSLQEIFDTITTNSDK